MIEQSSIDRILDRADIGDVAKNLIPDLVKSGASFKANSPFSSEKTPSFFVVPSKQIFKCFSSGKGGGVIQLVQAIKGLDFVGAMEYLADFYNEKLERTFESNDPKAQELRSKREEADLLIREVAERYTKALLNNPSAEVKDILVNRGYTSNEIAEWGLGFAADDWQGITSDIIEKGKAKIATEIGLCAEGNGRTYDFLRNRLTFSITNKRGKVIGIAGRVLDDSKPKYLNPKESFLYDKSFVLYGLHNSLPEITRTGEAFLVEGYTDVIACHKAGLSNTVASCGTALVRSQIKQLPKACRKVVVMYDGDKAGIKATYRAIQEIRSAGLIAAVCSLPENQDPDDFFRDVEDLDSAIETLRGLVKDAYEWEIDNALRDREGLDFDLAMENMVTMCAGIGKEVTRERVLKYLAKASKMKVTSLRRDITSAAKVLAEQYAKSGKEQRLDEDMVYLPPGCDRDMYDAEGFTRNKSRYYFHLGDKLRTGTNFVIEPLYHIRDNDNDQRLFLLSNAHQEELVSIRTDDIFSFTTVKKELGKRGNFTFDHRFKETHYNQLLNFLMANFPTAHLIQTLGQQKEGFYAYANGIAHKGEFFEVDNYGMVDFLDEYKTGGGELKSEQKKFFLPAYSEIGKGARSDEDEYENERKMVMKQSTIGMQEWQELFLGAFGKEKALIGIAFTISTCFRDLYIKSYQSFPILQCYGEKGSGKSAFSTCIENFFFFGQQPFMLNTGTEVGFFRRLSRVVNAATFFDEYTEALDNKRFQALKSGWNGVGREKGRFSNDKRTVTDKVNGALIVGGQYLSARDDFSLTTRSLLLEFVKVKARPKPQTDAFRKLQEAYSKGLNSLVMEVIRHRDYFKSKYVDTYQKINKEIREDLKDEGVDDRSISNYSMILTTVRVLEDRIDMAFKYSELYDLCKDKILEARDVVTDGEALAVFWGIIKQLFKAGTINPSVEYVVEDDPGSILKYEKGNSTKVDVSTIHKVLFLRVEDVHGFYNKEHRQQYGESGLNKATLLGYLKSRDYFIGSVRQKKIGGVNTSCFALNYDVLSNDFGLNLERPSGDHPSKQNSTPPPPPAPESEEDELPF